MTLFLLNTLCNSYILCDSIRGDFVSYLQQQLSSLDNFAFVLYTTTTF